METLESKPEVVERKFELEKAVEVSAKITYEVKNEEQNEYSTSISFTPSVDKIILHWGVYPKGKQGEWNNPYTLSPADLPKDSKIFDSHAVQTLLPASLNFTSSSSQQGMNFVFFNQNNNKWYNNNSQNFNIPFTLKSSKVILKKIGEVLVPNYVNDVVEKESTYNCWSLMHRYNLCYDTMTSFIPVEAKQDKPNDDVQWILIWLRYSNTRQLDWQRHYNTRPVLLSNSLSKLTSDIVNRYCVTYKSEKDYDNLSYSYSNIYKHILCLIGKGTGNGQEIRDEILHINHRHRMKQGGDRFYEEWHQKLHNNTTPDDIVICEAVLAFLRTGEIQEYWKTLLKGGITKERLESYERKITLEPKFVRKELIPEFENFLRILKSVHSSTDLDTMYNSAKNTISEYNRKLFDEIIANKSCQDSDSTLSQIERITKGREKLNEMINGFILNSNISEKINEIRDLIFFDIALENHLRQIIENIIHIQQSYEYYVKVLEHLLKNMTMIYKRFTEVILCSRDWENINVVVKSKPSLKTKSILNRIMILMHHFIDWYNQNIQPKAIYFGKECNIDENYIKIFSEEMIRGSLLFVVSMTVKKIDIILRKELNIGDWGIISIGEKTFCGKCVFVENLIDVQYEKYDDDTIILTQKVSGEEEIPKGCKGVLLVNSEAYPDTLAHVSVRARNCNVGLVVCFNEEKGEQIKKEFIDKQIKIEINGENNVNITLSDKKQNQSSESSAQENNLSVSIEDPEIDFSKDMPCTAAIDIDDFEKFKLYLGKKSYNTFLIHNKIPNCSPWLNYPKSFAIVNYFQNYLLSFPENAEIRKKLEEKEQKLSKEELPQKEIQSLLIECKSLIMEINNVENSYTYALKQALEKFGIKDYFEAFKTMKTVWASKYNERVYISCMKSKIPFSKIKIAVLVQKIITADYSFVIHTKNPINNNPDELYAEIVNGQGESLVGAYEGQSFSFVYQKKEKNFTIKSYQNKPIKLTNKGYIFRSDSNIEDTSNFSGAGLFDSVTMTEYTRDRITYYYDKLLFDDEYAHSVMDKVAKIGLNTEELYKSSQDIEGVLTGDNFYIVQSRPQV